MSPPARLMIWPIIWIHWKLPVSTSGSRDQAWPWLVIAHIKSACNSFRAMLFFAFCLQADTSDVLIITTNTKPTKKGKRVSTNKCFLLGRRRTQSPSLMELLVTVCNYDEVHEGRFVSLWFAFGIHACSLDLPIFIFKYNCDVIRGKQT